GNTTTPGPSTTTAPGKTTTPGPSTTTPAPSAAHPTGLYVGSGESGNTPFSLNATFSENATILEKMSIQYGTLPTINITALPYQMDGSSIVVTNFTAVPQDLRNLLMKVKLTYNHADETITFVIPVVITVVLRRP
ncbi:hypothetical protein Pmar_PMAR018102, partial [Perkinsus marinus ATCC 50983]